jgi:hypothetical protein
MERQRADRAEQGREGERSRADALRDRLNVMQAQLADAGRHYRSVPCAFASERRRGAVN